MSLINDALRDLDSRTDSSASRDEIAQEEASAPLASPTHTSHRGRRVVMLTAVIVLGSYAGYEGYTRLPVSSGSPLADTKHSPNAANVNAVSAAAAVNAIAPDTQPPKTVEEKTTAEKTSQKIAAIENKSNTDVRINALLADAQAAISRNRLSVPAGNNALYFLDQIRAHYSKNTEATERANLLRAQVRERYEGQLHAALADGNHERAAYLLSRSEKFGVSIEQVQVFEQSLQTIMPVVSNSGPKAPVAQVSKGESPRAEKKAVVQRTQAAPEKTQSVKENIPAKSAEQDRWVTLTSSSQEMAIIADAKAHLNRGAQARAEGILSQYVNDNPGSIEANSFLFDHYLATRRVDKAQALLAGLPQGHALHTYFNAQIANVVHGPERAINILEASAPGERVSKQHRVLLAGLYQKTSRHQAAFDLYKVLLREDENSLVALLGFALSADNLGDGPASLAAYRRIAHLGHPNESVQRYVEKRISTLEINDLAEATPW